jgi:hypothetical protein
MVSFAHPTCPNLYKDSLDDENGRIVGRVSIPDRQNLKKPGRNRILPYIFGQIVESLNSLRPHQQVI